MTSSEAAGPMHSTAAILSIGDELTLGQGLDTNSRWLATRLLDVGITPVEHATVPDDSRAIGAAMLRLAERTDVLITTGGLGPTADDLTRDALADAMGDRLVEDPHALEWIRTWFASRGRELTELNRVQALRPGRGECIDNPFGTAPGIAGALAAAGREVPVYCLPGPPREMRPMFEAHIAGRLRPARAVCTRVILTFGLGESEVAARLGELMRRTRMPLVGTTASKGVVTCRIRYEGPKQQAAEAERAVEDAAAQVREKLGDYVFGEGERTLAGAVLELLMRAGQKVATVESCTGGLVGAMLTEEPGSSAAYVGGWVTYSNEMKQREVGVPAAIFEPRGPGAVSLECAMAMAAGGRERSGAEWAVAITGIAGPDGGTAEKPVGTVWIAVHGPGIEAARRFVFAGERANIRDWAAQSSLAMLRLAMIERLDLGLLRQAEERRGQPG